MEFLLQGIVFLPHGSTGAATPFAGRKEFPYLLSGASAFVHGLHRKAPNALKNIRLCFFPKEIFSVISDFIRVSVYVFTDLSSYEFPFK